MNKIKYVITTWLIDWICAWMDMISGFISVVTFTAWSPWWNFKFKAMLDKYRVKGKLKKRDQLIE